MENFISYLQFVKTCLEDNFARFKSIHIVLGNESCDIDSSISAIILGYFLHFQKPSKIPTNSLIIPVQNVCKESFPFRTDTCYLYKEIGLPLDLLVYKDQLSFETLMKTKNVTTSLVDHHVLTESQKILESTVIQIIDHRPLDVNASWNENKVDLIIEQVGSCATLIADQIISTADGLLFREIGYLLYATIIFDTQSLSPETKRAKELDFKIAEYLETNYNFPDRRENLYKKIWKAHNDVSHLTPKQILTKDCKVVKKVPVPGLPMLAEDFLNLDGAYEAIRLFAIDNNVPLLVIMGIDTTEVVRRDIAIFFTTDGEKLMDKLLEMLCNCQQVKGYDFQFKEINTEFEDIKCFRQENVTLSRKQIIPIILDAVEL
ncbi:exopolyphosphatase PRUNE1-like [Diorhabda carinulata]|uniref:exopolyphosphatase PRUNE1-like n=1 Tax=Diorhabda carinulata TaxID=1163345 RepID=UPI0025A11F6F|nr:exopolyphosphatase PRUNE1-like [Diorhabda carinulata]